MRWVFHVPIAGDITALMVGTFFYVFALLSLGLLISTRAQNQMQALQMSMMFILPSVFFSGFIFPRETMPRFSTAISTVIPGHVLHRAGAGDHPARREPGRFLVSSRDAGGDGDGAVRAVRVKISQEMA
jgi:hypothetical protein